MSQSTGGERDSREQYHLALDRLRRRRMWRSIVIPFAFAATIVLVYGAIAFVLPSPVQVAVLSDSALTLLLLCPAVFCLFPLSIGAIALVALMRRWQSGTLSPLRRMETWAASLERNADKWLGHIDERVLNWAVAFAPIRQLLATFDTLSDEASEEGGQ